MEEKNKMGILKLEDTTYETEFSKKYLNRKPFIPKDPSKATAFIPGIVRKINVKLNDKVMRGQSLLFLEAMKMNNDIKSTFEGKVKAIYVKEGDLVAKGQLLMEFEK